MGDQYIYLGVYKAASVSIGKCNMLKVKYNSLLKTYTILSCGRNSPKQNYKFCVDAIKVVSLMQNLQEKLHLKSGRLRNVTISVHNYIKKCV